MTDPLRSSDRYETAADLADDLRRFLAGRPIRARRPSPLDRLAKWTRRHAPIAVTTAAFTVVLAVSLLLLSILYAAREHEARVEAEDARRDSEAARIDAEAARRDAEDAQLDAESARMTAETVTRYLVDAFRSPDPQRDGQTITVAEVLDRTAAELQDQFADQPLVKASLLDALGQAYNGLGLYRQAESLFEQTLELRQQELGREHPDTLTSMIHLAGNRISVGRYEDAVPLYEETFRLTREHLGQEHSKTLHSMRNLAGTYRTAGRYDQAIRLNEETLELCREHLRAGDPHTLFTMHNLAAAYLGAGRHRQAIPLLEETLALFQDQFGEDHPHNLAPINNLAVSYGAIGKYDEAVELHEKSLELHRAQLGPSHPDTLRAMHNLAATYRGPERSHEAIALHEQTVQLCRTHLGDEHPQTLNSMRSLIVGYQVSGRHLEASHLSEELVTRERKVRPGTLHHSRALALALTYLLPDQRNAEAEEYARECLAICQQQMPDDWLTFHTKVSLGRSLAGQKRYEEAELWLIDGYQGMIARRANIPPNLERRLTETLDVIILFYENRNKPDEAQRWRLVRDAQSDDPSKLIPSDVTDPEQIAARYLAWLDALPPDPKHAWDYPRSKLGRRIAESDELFARVIEARPDDHQLWIERGRMFALRSRWSEAVEAYRQARRPGIPIETFELACALLLSGDLTGYRELCVELAAAPDEPTDAVSAFHLAWITGIGPSGIEPDRAVAWAQRIVEEQGRAWHLHVLALAHYRAGDYVNTIRVSQQSEAAEPWPANFVNHWLLAIAHHRLDNPQGAVSARAEAERLAAKWAMPSEPGEAATCLPPDWLTLHLLRAEAADLPNGDADTEASRSDESSGVNPSGEPVQVKP